MMYRSCLALILSSGVLAQSSSAAVYEWTFDAGNLSPVLGPGSMAYADAATVGLTSFASMPIGSEPATFMHVPAFTAQQNGYLVTLAGSGPNGGGSYINQYTIVLDVLIPGGLNWTPFFNTNPVNDNDADFYVAPDGSLGIGRNYSPPNTILPDTWYRIAFVADLAARTVTYYVNGTQVAQGSDQADLNGRFSLYSNADPGADLLFFNEGDGSGTYTHEMNVAGLAIVDRSLTATEIAALGGPAAEGIFARRLQISRVNGTAVLNWRGAPNVVLQKTGDLQTPDWQTLPETVGLSNFSEPASGNAFYRLLTQ